MDEADKRMETDGKGLFIIRNGQKVATLLYPPERQQRPSGAPGARTFVPRARNQGD
jgi:hypothetical protein